MNNRSANRLLNPTLLVLAALMSPSLGAAESAWNFLLECDNIVQGYMGVFVEAEDDFSSAHGPLRVYRKLVPTGDVELNSTPDVNFIGAFETNWSASIFLNGLKQVDTHTYCVNTDNQLRFWIFLIPRSIFLLEPDCVEITYWPF